MSDHPVPEIPVYQTPQAVMQQQAMLQHQQALQHMPPGAPYFQAAGGLPPGIQQELSRKWNQQFLEMESSKSFKNHELPLARIKKIMKSDEDVRMISAEAPILFAKACEMFIIELTVRSWVHTEESKRRTLQRNDIAMAISKTDIFDFLIDIVPREDGKPPKKDINRPLMPPSDPSAFPQQQYLMYLQQQAQAQQMGMGSAFPPGSANGSQPSQDQTQDQEQQQPHHPPRQQEHEEQQNHDQQHHEQQQMMGYYNPNGMFPPHFQQMFVGQPQQMMQPHHMMPQDPNQQDPNMSGYPPQSFPFQYAPPHQYQQQQHYQQEDNDDGQDDE